MTFWSDQPRRTAFVKALAFGAGILHVTAAENALRISKSEGPRLAFGFSAGTNRFAALPKDPGGFCGERHVLSSITQENTWLTIWHVHGGKMSEVFDPV